MTFEIWLSGLGLVLALATFVFLIALRIRNNGIADIFWGMGFVALAFFTVRISDSDLSSPVTLTLLTMTIVWAFRLTGYIFLRNRGQEEDWRYLQWRQDWGKTWIWRSWLQVFLLQGFILSIIALPLINVISSPVPTFNFIHLAGALVWLTGFLFEAIGDGQLASFKKDPSNKGKLMTTGLWKYTRHPNYFGESLLWWGVWIFSIPSGLAWLTLLSPVLLTWLLLKVSGVAMLERKYLNRPDFQEYAQKTNAFLPWFPKI